MMKTQRPEALQLANMLRGIDARSRFANEKLSSASDELERLQSENERLRTYNKDARHEIANLQERVQQLGQLARDVNSRRVVELEAQLEAIGAGGVEPLRKRECLHQISEPAQPVAVERIGTMFFPSSPEHSILGIFLSAMSDQLKIDGPAMRDAMLWYCGVQEIATEPQPAAPAQADEYPPLVCDYCGALTPDPWHSSGMLHGKMSKHIHSCDACCAARAAQGVK